MLFMIRFKKSTEPQLDIDNANKILENIFAANQAEPNTIPLDVLAAYSHYRKKRFSLQKIVIIAMVLFLLLAFLFIVPSFTIHSETKNSEANPVYHVSVDTFMPVQRVTAIIDGHNIPVYEVDSHIYSIEPHINGRMKVAVTLINHQTVTQFVDVENVDTEAPLVVSSNMDSESVYLYLSDTGSGINYKEIKAVGLSGQEILPVSFDESSECVVFSYPKETLNVYIPDNADNTLHLILTVK